MDESAQILSNWIDEHADEIVESLRGVLRIRSIKEEAAGPGAPFGKPVREALDYSLELCERLGFAVRDVDGYAGHAEWGTGDEMVAAVGHLDVVPEGDGWSYPPFGAELHDGIIYARGASDDKGPTYAALWAAKAVMESGLTVPRRIRMIFGCDEESGFSCVKHYWQTAGEEQPVLAFTPDAGFPLVYAEKGILSVILEHDRSVAQDGVHVAEASGGRRGNMVPDAAEARLAGDAADLYQAVVALHRNWDRNVQVDPTPDGVIVRARGKSGHASRPSSGDNAIGRLARTLLTACGSDREWLGFVARSADQSGAGLGIQGRDAVAGPLTCNLAKVEADASTVRVTYNIRYPVTWTSADVVSRIMATAEVAGFRVARHTDDPPLHVPVDREPVSTLLRVYQEETQDTESRPFAMGGGTYARKIPNAVAFGARFPGVADGPAHEPDERIHVSSVLRAAKIYARALYELAKVDADRHE